MTMNRRDEVWLDLECIECHGTMASKEPPNDKVNPFKTNDPKESLTPYQLRYLRGIWNRDDFGLHYQNATWDRCPRIDKLNMRRELHAWHKSENKGMIISGVIGCGKTSMLGLMMACLASQSDFDFTYWYAPSLFNFLTTFTRADEVHRRKYDKLTSTRWLFIDDAGTEDNIDWKSMRFNELIERRYARNLLHVVTSNLDRERLTRREGWERAIDRIFENAFNWYDIGGESQRK